jgi:hypothetical protein
MRNKIKSIISLGLGLAIVLSFSPALAENSSISDTGTGRFKCVTESGKQVCVPVKLDCLKNATTPMISDDGDDSDSNCTPVRITDTNEGQRPVLKKLEEGRMKERQDKIQKIAGVYQAQIDRAQKAIDRMQVIVDRIKLQRAKLTGTTQQLADLDALVTKAEKQKQEAVTALADVKAKAATIKGTLATINTDTANATDTPTTNVTNLKQQVKDFQTSVNSLKKKLTALHDTLVQTVKTMKTIAKGSEEKPNTSNSGDEENE